MLGLAIALAVWRTKVDEFRVTHLTLSALLLFQVIRSAADLRSRAPVIHVDGQGLSSRELFGERIPWSNVADIRADRFQPGVSIELVDPAAYVETFPRRRPLHAWWVSRKRQVTVGAFALSRDQRDELVAFTDRSRRVPRS